MAAGLAHGLTHRVVAGTKKSLGQHWLRDRLMLGAIVDCADIQKTDIVLEIGPGLGTLTSVLLDRAERVVAVEFDEELARKLPAQFPGKNLNVIHHDFLTYEPENLPADYKVVANIPYYITAKIVQKLMTARNRPSCAVLLVQKEVAERIAAHPGDMSILAISAQIYAECSLGPRVEAHYFTPPPKVDSQVVIMKRRTRSLVEAGDETLFFRIVKAGFSARRKKLRSSLAGGLAISKPMAEMMLGKADISPDQRAEDLAIDDWLRLTTVLHQSNA